MPQDRPPVRIPLVSPPEWRDNIIRSPAFVQDAQLINCIAEFVPHRKRYDIRKRPGSGAIVCQAVAPGTAQGMYSFVTAQCLWIVGNVLQADTGFTSALAGGNTLPYQLIPIGFDGTSYDTLVKTNTGAWIHETSPETVTKIASNFPATTVPGAAYLDGTLYVMDQFGQIWGSNLNDPLTWNTTNKIVAQIAPDLGVAIIKHLVYVLAFKEWTTEVFFDAGNPAGSPLGSVPEALLNYGCANPYTIQDIDGSKFWLSNNKSGQPQVVRLDGLTPTVISTPPVEAYLSYFIPSPSTTFGKSGDTTFSFAFKAGGHRFYGLTNTYNNLTLVLDIDQGGLWYRWTDTAGNYWPYAYGGSRADLLSGKYVTGTSLQNIHNGSVYLVDADYIFPTDSGVSYAADIYTEQIDMSVDRTKLLSGLHVNSDITDTKAMVRYSDNDYQTWSQPRNIDVSNTRPYIADLGSFYRRAFHFRITSDQPMRMAEIDLQLDVGPV